MIQVDDYLIDVQQLLGAGACGKVFVASRRNDPKQYCAKIVQGNSNDVDKELKILNFMRDKQNDNIVNTFYANYVQEQGMYVIIMERCDSDLDKEIKKRQGKFTEQEALDIMKQLLNGYRILYQSQIVHRDIKPANILFQFGKYKIADFGVGKIYNADQNLQKMTKSGTPVFKAPELQGNYEWRQNDLNYINQQTTVAPYQQFKNNETKIQGDDKKMKIQHKVDIYSFGILFYLLLTGGYPFELTMNGIFSFIKEIKENPFRMNYQQFQISQTTASIVEKMLHYSPVERIGFPELIALQQFQIRMGTMFNPKTFVPSIPKQPIFLQNPPNLTKITIIPPHKQVQDWLNNLKSIFLEKCFENNQVIEIYRNYCDLCLTLAIITMEPNVQEKIIFDTITRYQNGSNCDIKFQMQTSTESGYYTKEFLRILSSQFVPKIFTYDGAKIYGEQHLRFIFIYWKLMNNQYSYWQQQQFLPFKEDIKKDANLTKDELRRFLDDNY